MQVQLGVAGHQHSPVGIGVKVIPCEDTAGAPPDPRGTWDLTGNQESSPAAPSPTVFPGIYTRIWGLEPEGVLIP